jgi:spore coat protein U-like protein
MVGLRGILTGLVLGSALVSRQAVAQSSSSLTHVVSVTVPPRVKVQVSNAPAMQTAVKVSSTQTATAGLSFTVSATQSWTLSIGSSARKSHLQWSRAQTSGFASVNGAETMIASGTISRTPTDATVFFRDAVSGAASDNGNAGSDTITLTVAAQ